jgi:hypothetical protein
MSVTLAPTPVARTRSADNEGGLFVSTAGTGRRIVYVINIYIYFKYNVYIVVLTIMEEEDLLLEEAEVVEEDPLLEIEIVQ